MPVIPSADSYKVTTSGQKIIKRALRLLGIKATGEELEASELQDGLEALNGMLDAWNADLLTVYCREIVTKAVDGSTSYTIGEGADIDTARPVEIRQGEAFFKTVDGYDYEVKVYDQRDFGNIWNKALQGTFPYYLYYDKSSVTGNVYLWPVPSTGTLVLYLGKKLAQVQQATVALQFPPSYYDALCYNLAIRLASEYGQKASQEVVATAIETRGALRKINASNPTMVPDFGVSNRTRASLSDLIKGY